MKRTVLFILSLFITVSIHSQTGKCWPNYRGNNILTGVTNSNLKTPLKLKWSFKTEDVIKSSPIICDKIIYVASTDGSIYAIDYTGRLKWKYNAEVSIEASPIIIKNTLIVGDLGGSVYAINAKTGKLIWKYKADGQISGSANWVTDGNRIMIIIPSYDFCIHSVDLKTGELIWKCETDNYLNGAPTTDNKKIIIGGCDAYMHIIDTQSGKETSKIEIGTYIAESSALLSNIAYVGDYDGGFFSIDLINKKIKWKFSNPTGSPFLSSPSVSKNKVVIGSQDKKVYCFNKETGKIEWTYQTFGKIESSPVIIKDKVVICSKDGFIRFISLDTGKSNYEFELGINIKSTPAVVNDMMVIGGEDGKIYMFSGSK